LYVSRNIMWVLKSRRLRSAGHVARMGEFWWWKHQLNRPLRIHRHRWEDNIKMDLMKKWDGNTCSGLMWLSAWASGRSCAHGALDGWGTGSLSRRIPRN